MKIGVKVSEGVFVGVIRAPNEYKTTLTKLVLMFWLDS